MATTGLSSAPLADYFWIAGVDGSEILDVYQKLSEEYRANNAAAENAVAARAASPTVTETIEEEDTGTEGEGHLGPHADRSRPDSTMTTRPVSYQRLSRLPSNNNSISQQNQPQRLSYRSGDSDPNSSHSNRSSATVRPALSPRGSSSMMDDFDFDRALVKFASEREHFLTDLSLSAGAITSSSRPKSRGRAQKITSGEPPSTSTQSSSNLLRSGIGSVRRHMALKDMNSMKRQPSVARQGQET